MFFFFFFLIVFALGGSPTPHPISSRPHFVCKFSRHGSSSGNVSCTGFFIHAHFQASGCRVLPFFIDGTHPVKKKVASS